MVSAILFVTEGLTVELIEPTKLAVAPAVSEEASEEETLALADEEGLSPPEPEAEGELLILTEGVPLAEADTVPESLNDILCSGVTVPDVVREAISLALYVPETVSVTPVGKVVILGVEVPPPVTLANTVPEILTLLDLPGEALTTADLETSAVLLIVRDPCAVKEGITVKVIVGEAECDRLALPERCRNTSFNTCTSSHGFGHIHSARHCSHGRS